MDDEKLLGLIKQVLARGHDVEIRYRENGQHVVLEIRREKIK